MTYEIAGARCEVIDPETVLRQAQEWASARGAEVLVANAALVFGRDHLESAVLHAERARDSRTMTTRSLPMETLLYLAAQRQVADAIRTAGITKDTRTAALVVFGGGPVDELIAHLGWSRDDSVLREEGKDLGRLGIPTSERGTVSAAQAVDLALERTAMVDVNK